MKNVGQDRSWLISATAVFIAWIPRLGGEEFFRKESAVASVALQPASSRRNCIWLSRRLAEIDQSVSWLRGAETRGGGGDTHTHTAGFFEQSRQYFSREKKKRKWNIFKAGNLPRIILRFEIATPSGGTRIRRGSSPSFARQNLISDSAFFVNWEADSLRHAMRCLSTLETIDRVFYFFLLLLLLFFQFSTSIFANLSYSSLFQTNANSD